jgi:hypothetical protein
MIMSSILITAAGLSTVILSSLRQSRAIDDAIVAYYAAESGVERGIYELRQRGEQPAERSETLGNGAGYETRVTTSEPVVYADAIDENAFLEIALYDPEQPTTATGIAAVEIDWTDDCGGCTVLEAGLVRWEAGGPIAWDPNAAFFRFTGGTASLSAMPAELYRLRLIAHGGRMRTVQVRARDGSGSPLALPGRVTIDAVGDYVTARQRLTASMPRETPLSGLYDFVLFSECSLVKGGPVGCPAD